MRDNSDLFKVDSKGDSYIDPISGDKTILTTKEMYQRNMARISSDYEYLLSTYGPDDCYCWRDSYKSLKFRPKVRTTPGVKAYVQFILLNIPAPDSLVDYQDVNNVIRNTCGNIWCCNVSHLVI